MGRLLRALSDPWYMYRPRTEVERALLLEQSGKSGTILESSQASGVRKAHYAWYYVRKSSILLAGTGIRKISSVTSWFNPFKIHFSDCLKSFISKIN